MEKLGHKRLAEGEATGHYHEATSDTAVLYGDMSKMILDAPDGTDVTHQEHRVLVVPPGKHDRLIVREFDPFKKVIDSVRD